MDKKSKREVILYVHIQEQNLEWIKKQMKKLEYPETRGRSEFIDDLLTQLRLKKL